MSYGVNDTHMTVNNSYGTIPDAISKFEFNTNKVKPHKFANTGTLNKLMFVSPS